jgi:hypothetical protein
MSAQLTSGPKVLHGLATWTTCVQRLSDIRIFFARIFLARGLRLTVEAFMAEQRSFAHVDAWLDAVFSYGESRRIPVVIVRVGANLMAIANLGPNFDVTLAAAARCAARPRRRTASGSRKPSSAR